MKYEKLSEYFKTEHLKSQVGHNVCPDFVNML